MVRAFWTSPKIVERGWRWNAWVLPSVCSERNEKPCVLIIRSLESVLGSTDECVAAHGVKLVFSLAADSEDNTAVKAVDVWMHSWKRQPVFREMFDDKSRRQWIHLVLEEFQNWNFRMKIKESVGRMQRDRGRTVSVCSSCYQQINSLWLMGSRCWTAHSFYSSHSERWINWIF